MTSPRVFISYSHDSREHADAVRALSDRLRNEGVDANIDQYEEDPGWPRWMEAQIRAADFVLMICTPQYRREFEDEKPEGRGVAWESKVIYNYVYRNKHERNKFLPVFLSEPAMPDIPVLFTGATFYSLKDDQGYKRLFQRLTGQRHCAKPELGSLRPLASREQRSSLLHAPVTAADEQSGEKPKQVKARPGIWRSVRGRVYIIIHGNPKPKLLYSGIALAAMMLLLLGVRLEGNTTPAPDRKIEIWQPPTGQRTEVYYKDQSRGVTDRYVIAQESELPDLRCEWLNRKYNLKQNDDTKYSCDLTSEWDPGKVVSGSKAR